MLIDQHTGEVLEPTDWVLGGEEVPEELEPHPDTQHIYYEDMDEDE